MSGSKRSVPWYNRCLFECSLCQQQSNSKGGIEGHLKTCPWAAASEERAKEKMIKKVLHECVECGMKTLHERDSIERHVRDRHGLGLNEYGDRHGFGGLPETPVKETGTTTGYISLVFFRLQP